MKKIGSILAAALVAVACSPENEGVQEASLEVSPSQLTFGAEDTAPQEITVTAVGVEWEYVLPSTADWITVEDGTAGKLLVTVAANPAAEARTASVTVRPTDNDDVKAKNVTVKQEGNANPVVYSLTVEPASLTFGAEGAAPQEVTVTTEGEGLTWSTSTEADWLTVTEKAGGFTVSAADNPDTSERTADITVTPSESSASPKAVRVVQEGKVLPPSLTLSYEGGPLPEEFTLAYNDMVPRDIDVVAVNVTWNVSVEYEGEQTDRWLTVAKVEDVSRSHVVLQVIDGNQNLTSSPRSCVVRITADVEGIGPFEVRMTQEGKPEFDSTLTEDIDFGTLTNSNVLVYLTKNEEQTYALWDLRLWGDGITYDVEYGRYSGSGDLVTVYVASDPIYQNDDKEYYLPDGTYTVVANFYSDSSLYVPFNISAGYRTYYATSHTWYVRMQDGVSTGDACITTGTMEVKRSGETYSITFDFGSDALYGVKGSFEGTFDIVGVY